MFNHNFRPFQGFSIIKPEMSLLPHTYSTIIKFGFAGRYNIQLTCTRPTLDVKKNQP